MKKLVLVYNPISGDALFKYKLDEMIEKFEQHDCIVIPYRTKADNRGAFPVVVRTVRPEGIIIAGGDGTIHDIVNIMISEELDDLPVGLIPSGTSNDFASFLGIDKNLDHYLQAVARGATIPIDIGKSGDQYFINVASAGVLTSVAHKVDAGLKNAIGKMAYYLRGLGEIPNFHARRMKIAADQAVIDEKVLLFVIINSGTVGSMKNVAVNAKVNDGKLDLLVVKQCGMPELMTLMMEMLAGSDLTSHKSVIYLQAKDIRIECDEEIESDLDGELGPRLPLEVTTLEGKIQLFYEEPAK